MSLCLYQIYVRHPETKEVLHCLGQGETVQAALADAGKVINEPFRPKQDGGAAIATHCNITLPSGEKVLRRLKAFESGAPYSKTEQPHVPGMP